MPRLRMMLWLIFMAASIPLMAAQIDSDAADTSQMIRDLAKSSWKNRIELLRQLSFKRNQKGFLANSAVKQEMISLLTSGIKFQKDFIADQLRQKSTLQSARDKFQKEFNNNGYSDYMALLFTIVISYDDIDTIPAFLDGLQQYGGLIEVDTFYKFGKPAVDALIKATLTEDKEQKEAAFSVLSMWVQRSLDLAYHSDSGPLDEGLKLNEVELKKIRDSMIKGLVTSNINQISYINYGIYALAKAERDSSKKNYLKNILKNSFKNADGFVRLHCIEFIAEIGDLSDIKELENMKDDTFVDPVNEFYKKREIQASGTSKRKSTYLIREKTVEAIEQIERRFNK